MGVDKPSKQLEIAADCDTEVREPFRVGQKLGWQVLFRNHPVCDRGVSPGVSG